MTVWPVLWSSSASVAKTLGSSSTTSTRARRQAVSGRAGRPGLARSPAAGQGRGEGPRPAVVSDLLLPPGPGDRHRVLDDLIDVDSDELLLRAEARKRLDAPHRFGAVERRRLHDIERAVEELGVPGVLLHELRVTEDRLEQVVEVVRDPAGELPEGRVLLSLVELLLDLALRGDVADDRDGALELTLAPVEGGERDGVGRGAALR